MRYSIIYVDPAWTYDDKALAGSRGAGCKYKLMTDVEMQTELPVGSLAATDSVLFMWATYPKLQEALDLGRSWGFQYKTVAFTWVKTTPAFGGLLEWIGRALPFQEGVFVSRPELVEILKRIKTLWFIGMGRWTRSNAEVVLLFVKGKPKRVDAGVNQIVATVPGRHSAKPAEVRDRIVRLMGDVPRVELFAREATEGWESLGYDVDGMDLRESIPLLASAEGPGYADT